MLVLHWHKVFLYKTLEFGVYLTMMIQTTFRRLARAAILFPMLAFWHSTVFAELPLLIPRSVLLGNPAYGSPAISPDGTHIAYEKADTNGVMQLWIRDIAGDQDRQVTNEQSTQDSGSAPFWAYDGELLYLKDSKGNEMEHLFACNPLTGKVRDLTPFSGIKVKFLECCPKKPNQVLITLNREGNAVFDVWAVDLSNGALQPVMENPGDVTQWIADASLKIRAVVGKNKDGSGELRFLTKENSWKTLSSSVNVLGLSRD
jgi:hypothetical protein